MRFQRILWSIVLGVTAVGFWVDGYAQQPLPELPYVPTPQEVVLEMLKMAEVTRDDIVYDLGCGDELDRDHRREAFWGPRCSAWTMILNW